MGYTSLSLGRASISSVSSSTYTKSSLAGSSLPADSIPANGPRIFLTSLSGSSGTVDTDTVSPISTRVTLFTSSASESEYFSGVPQ